MDLVLCEESQAIAQALRALGREAYSLDVVDTRGNPAWHIKGDALTYLREARRRRQRFGLIVIHPPCTYLTNAGARWLYMGGARYRSDGTENAMDPERYAAMVEAAEFYTDCRDAALLVSDRVAIENPIFHGYAEKLIDPKTRQFVQPYWFGVPELKATGWELYGLDPLVPTEKLEPPKAGTPARAAWSKVHRASPGPDRQRERSATHPKAAAAYAAQFTRPRAEQANNCVPTATRSTSRKRKASSKPSSPAALDVSDIC